MIRLRLVRMRLPCPICKGIVTFREGLAFWGGAEVYEITCPSCSGELYLSSYPHESAVVDYASRIIYASVIAAIPLSAHYHAIPYLAAFLLLVAVCFSALLRAYTLEPAAVHSALDTSRRYRDLGGIAATALSSFVSTFMAEGGWLSHVARGLCLLGAAAVLGGFSLEQYLGLLSTLGWVAQWVGLALLFRKQSAIISCGGGFLIACIVMLVEGGIGSLLRNALH
jgi:hypothetical protein